MKLQRICNESKKNELKKVLFINLPSFCYTDKFRDSINPPLNIAYLISSLNDVNIESDVLDLFIESIKKFGIKKNNKYVNQAVYSYPEKEFILFLKKELLSKLSKGDYNIVGLNGDLFKISFFILREVKEYNPNIKTIVGGNLCTFNPGSFLDKDCVDYVVQYEAESTIKQLIISILENKNINNTGGIYYKKDGSYIKTELPRLGNINDISPPDYSKFDMESYLELNKNRIIVISARGCRADCNFCGMAKISRSIRIRDPVGFVQEIEDLKEKYGIKRFTFYNAMMNLTYDHITDICNELIRRQLDIKWSCFIRADKYIDKNVLKLMKKAGCELISLGIETGSKKINKICNKKIDISFAKKIISYCRNEGIIVRCSFMYGLPKENFLDFLKTIFFIAFNSIDIVRINRFTYDAGSKFYKDIEKYNEAYFESIFSLHDYNQQGLIFRIKQRIVNLTFNLVNLKKFSLRDYDF